MTDSPAFGAGFRSVDDAAEPDRLVESMVRGDEHPAVRTLRAWSASQLGLGPGHHAVEVGCGPGTAAADLADSVGETGRAVGVDFSEAMLDQARALWSSMPWLTFELGDARDLDIATDSFDAYRCERTFQHLDAPERALAEAVRIVRPGGRVAIIDTDWGTRALDHPDPDLDARLWSGISSPIANPMSGRRLRSMCLDAGLVDVASRAEVLLVTEWDPDASPAVGAFPPFAMVAQFAAASGALTDDEAATWLALLEDSARRGRFFLCVTMVAVVGTVPASPS